MICQACGQETEEGRFCTHCGNKLSMDESAAATSPLDESEANTIKVPAAPMEGNEQSTSSSVPEDAVMETHTQSESSEANEFVEKLKDISTDFGQLFLDQLKRPMNAREVNHTHLTSGIISIIIFALIISLNIYLGYREYAYDSVFLDGFLLPFIQFLVLFAIVVSLIFAGVKLCNQSLSFTDIVAKYGAYAVPFLALYVIAIISSLINLDSIFILAVTISLLGAVLIIPAVIVLEQKSRSFDELYIIIGMNILALIAFGLLTSSLTELLLGSLMYGIF